MRNLTTVGIGEEYTRKWVEFQERLPYHSVDEFIKEQEDAFDIIWLRDGGIKDKYAAFHVIRGRSVVTIYYWKRRDEWYAKY